MRKDLRFLLERLLGLLLGLLPFLAEAAVQLEQHLPCCQPLLCLQQSLTAHILPLLPVVAVLGKVVPLQSQPSLRHIILPSRPLPRSCMPSWPVPAEPAPAKPTSLGHVQHVPRLMEAA